MIQLGTAGMYEDMIPASIGDYVWYDEDNDGIQDVGEHGLLDITVKLYYNGGALSRHDHNRC